MKSKLLHLFAATLALLAGCVPSVFPLLNEGDLVYEPDLIGAWTDDDSTWTFTKQKPDPASKTYTLAIKDKNGATAEFEALLGRIGGKLFLDISPTDLGKSGKNICQWAAISLIPGHLFFRVWEVGPKLKFTAVRADHLSSLLKKDPKLLAHRVVSNDGVVLAATTADLQAFFIQHADDEELFPIYDIDGLTRVASTAEKK